MKKAIIVLFCLSLGFAAYAQNFGDSRMSDADKAIVSAEMGILKLQGLTPMRFADALTGKPIPKAAIDIKGIGTFTTNTKGIITFPRHADGRFTLVFSKEGYITTPIDFEIQLGNVIFNWFSISPGMSGDYRFVLDWGEKPADLDIHFEKEDGYHVSWRNMHSASEGNVTLDRDDTAGYGPETITAEKVQATNAYSLYVMDYTNRSAQTSKALSLSGATIRVYGDNRLLYTFTVPPNVQGIRWDVFQISKGIVVPVNTVGN
jgi:hypothetical protein